MEESHQEEIERQEDTGEQPQQPNPDNVDSPQQPNPDNVDSLEPEIFEFTEESSGDDVIVIESYETQGMSDNGDDSDNGGDDSSNDSLEPEYIEKDDDANSSEKE